MIIFCCDRRIITKLICFFPAANVPGVASRQLEPSYCHATFWFFYASSSSPGIFARHDWPRELKHAEPSRDIVRSVWPASRKIPRSRRDLCWLVQPEWHCRFHCEGWWWFVQVDTKVKHGNLRCEMLIGENQFYLTGDSLAEIESGSIGYLSEYQESRLCMISSGLGCV